MSRQALTWIVRILRKKNIPFRISGGFAANIYGSKGKLRDIDIEIPDDNFKDIIPEVKSFITLTPYRYKDKFFNIYRMRLRYKGQKIDFSGSKTEKLYNPNKRRWEKSRINLKNAEKKKIYNLIIPVIPKKELIEYKKQLARKIDKEDIAEIS